MTWRSPYSRRFRSNYKPQSQTGAAAGVLKRLVTVLLTVCLVSSATPAAPQTIVFVARESRIGFTFWFNASGLAKVMQGQGMGTASVPEKQTDRDAKVSRLQIFPGDVTIDPSDHVRFSAIAYDRNNNPVGGVKIKWSIQGLLPGKRIRLTPQGGVRGNGAGIIHNLRGGSEEDGTGDSSGASRRVAKPEAHADGHAGGFDA